MTGKYIFIFLIVSIIRGNPRKWLSSQVMNLFFKSYRICLIFFILFACESGFNWGIAQDYSFFPYPWIQEINLPEHFADIPNESFYLDNTGTLFLGKANGLSVISESNSYHLQMEGPVYVSGNGSDTIYYACKNDMGFLLNDRSGKFTIRSQKDRIARVNRNFTPSRLICTHEAVFINTNRGVYHYWKGRIQSFPFPGVMGRLHLVGGRLVLRMNQAETYLWTGRGFRRMTDHEIGLDPALLIPGQIELREGFKFYNYLANDESIAISGKDGLVILDQSGKVVAALGKREGLSGHDIRQVSMCDGEELWILGAYSLHKINHPSTLEIIELRPETYGRIYVSEISGRSIFLGTSHGLFVAEPDEGERGRWNIRNIAGDQPESFLLMTRAGNQIFAAGSKHLVTINRITNHMICRVHSHSTDKIPCRSDSVYINWPGTSRPHRHFVAVDCGIKSICIACRPISQSMSSTIDDQTRSNFADCRPAIH